MPKSLNDQAFAVLSKHLSIGQKKADVGFIGETSHKRFTSVRSFQDCVSTLARIAKSMNVNRLKHITPEMAQRYLLERKEQSRAGTNVLHAEQRKKYGTTVSQKTLDAERKALAIFLKSDIARVKTPVKALASPRAYTPDQVKAICSKQSERFALATEIAYEAGLRAKELITIRKAGELDITSTKEWHKDRFAYAPSNKYVVQGKGGLIREIRLSDDLSKRLEARRYEEAMNVRDRGVNYKQYYDIAGGANFSSSFSRASSIQLGFSNGAHGLRHGYAQERHEIFKDNGYSAKEAKSIVSQEVGHFRAEITEVYLR